MSEDRTPYGKNRKLSYREAADVLLGSPTTSVWLKDAIIALDQRATSETLEECAVLLQLQKMRAA